MDVERSVIESVIFCVVCIVWDICIVAHLVRYSYLM